MILFMKVLILSALPCATSSNAYVARLAHDAGTHPGVVGTGAFHLRGGAAASPSVDEFLKVSHNGPVEVQARDKDSTTIDGRGWSRGQHEELSGSAANITAMAAEAPRVDWLHVETVMMPPHDSERQLRWYNLDDPLRGNKSTTCPNSDINTVGMQPMEDLTLLVRVLCTIVASSIISAWVDKWKTQRLLLFFAHWCSGLIYLLMEWLMASMVFACWSTRSTSNFIKFLKFVELTADNMVVITNLSICANLAIIVANSKHIARIKSAGSPRMVWSFVAVSVLITLTSAPFWSGDLITTGTQYWIESTGQTVGQQRWISVAQFMLEFGSGVVMLLIMAMLVIFRRPELKHCWAAHRRIKYYFLLSCTAFMVNLAVGIGGVLWLAVIRDPRFIVVGWSMRHVHIALDTLVLYGVLVKPSEQADRSPGDTEESKNGSPPVGKEKSSTDGRIPVMTL